MEVPARARRLKVVTGNDSSALPEASLRFEAFFRQNYPAVVRLAYSVSGDLAAAEDVAQEVFLAALRRFPEGAEQGVGWLRVAAIHTALNAIRGERRRDRRHQDVAALHALPGPDPAESIVDRESHAEVRNALGRLPRRSAAVLVMRHGGMSYSEIAGAVGVRVGQVGTMLRRAESALTKELDRATRN